MGKTRTMSNKDIDKQILAEITDSIENGKMEVKQITDPMELLLVAAEMLDWRIAMPEADENGEIDGLVIGTQEFIDDNIVDLDSFDVMVSDTESLNDEEI